MPKNLPCHDFWGSLHNFIHIITSPGPEEVSAVVLGEILGVKAAGIWYLIKT